MEFIFDYLPLPISLLAILATVMGWRKNRAIYGIESITLRQLRGRRDDEVYDEKLKQINAKLKSGKFAILHVTTREADGDYEIFLSKIKK